MRPWRRWPRFAKTATQVPEAAEKTPRDFSLLVADAERGSSYAWEALTHHLIAVAVDGAMSDAREIDWLRGQDESVWRRLESVPRYTALYSDVYPPVERVRECLRSSPSTLLAVMASFHPSGYVREQAVDVLADRRDSLSDSPAFFGSSTGWTSLRRKVGPRS